MTRASTGPTASSAGTAAAGASAPASAGASTAASAGARGAPCPPHLRAAFVRACGMADDTAVAWLDAVHPAWERTWRRCGAELLSDVSGQGQTDLADRLSELFGTPGAVRR